MALAKPSWSGESALGEGHGTGATETLAFMPRLFVLTTLPHRRPHGNRFERVNGWQSMRMVALRRVGLPYGVYPRLVLMFITTEAVRKKSREIYLGATPNDLVRKLGLSTVSGPRGTAQRLEAQLRKLISTTWSWRSVGPASHFAVSRRTTPTAAPSLRTLAVSLGLPRASWLSCLILHESFFSQITRSAVPVDLRAIAQLKGSPLALDLYTWLTYRMSYLRKPTLVPWKALQAQLGADYARPRDFRRAALARLEDVVSAYPELRIRGEKEGVRLYPSPPHVKSHALKTEVAAIRLFDFFQRPSP
ncbi:MAG: replication protein RepA [Thermoanaerobaculia bacterium]